MSKLRYSFVVVFLCIFQSIHASLDSSDLQKVLAKTTKFFERLKINYESQPATPELYRKIDEEVDEFVRKVKESNDRTRGKRHVDQDKDIGIFKGLKTVPDLVLSDSLDVTFFSRLNGTEQRSYAATLNSSDITIFQLRDGSFVRVGSHDLQNGTRIVSHNFEEATLIVVQRSFGDTHIFRLSRENDCDTQPLRLNKIQTLDTPKPIDSTIWRGIKQIYLAIVTIDNLIIYEWLGEHFDRIQTMNIQIRKILAFQTSASMHLLAIHESQTLVLKFSLQTKKFVVVQKLRGANSATFFHVEKFHHTENFIVLADKNSSVVYKQTRHRFVAFQKLLGAKKICSLTMNDSIVLFFVGNDEIEFYQYDGWKFVGSGMKVFGVFDGFSVSLGDEKLVAMRVREFELMNNENDRVGKDFEEIVDDDEGAGILGVRKGGFESFVWRFGRIEWRMKKSLKSLRKETNIWCRESLKKAQRVPHNLPATPETIRIQRGYLKKLQTHEVNNVNADEFANLSDRWNKIVSETMEREKEVKNYVSKVNPILTNVLANDVRVDCTGRCQAEIMETAVGGEFVEGLRRFDDVERNFDFRRVKVSFVENLPCPVPAPKFREATVTGLVNGIVFDEFVEDVLKVTGDQQLKGPFAFAKLQVDNARIRLDIASNFTRQHMSTLTLQANELDIKAGGLLLPLNGSSSVVTGSLTVAKARINGLVNLRGTIRGQGAQMLTPMIHITDPLRLPGNVSLRNVKIVETVTTRDLTRSKGKTFYEIITNAVPLDADRIPVHYKFRHDKVSWKNMTLRDFPYKWLTKKNVDRVVITGPKRATKSHLGFEKLPFENLPIPKLPMRLCSPNVISEAIWESSLVVDRAVAKSVKTFNVIEDSGLRNFYFDAAKSFDEVPWNLKTLTGRVIVEKAHIDEIVGMDYQGLKKTMEKWIEPGHLKGPIIVPNLKIQHLETSMGFVASLPLEVGNVVPQKNIYIDKLNNVDFKEFLKNVVKLDDTVSLKNVTFVGSVVAKEIYAKQTSFSLQEDLASGYFGSKEILGTLESEAMIVPNIFEFPSDEVPINIIASGNVRFEKEPKIVTVNKKNLNELYNDVWLTDRATVASVNLIEFENVTFENNLTLLKSFNTPNLGPWSEVENRILSKTKSQSIKVTAAFNSLEAPNVIGAAKSRLLSNISYLQDLEDNSLKKNSTQVITTSWNFDELIIVGNYEILGRVNGLNLEKDVARYDVEKNLITGKKIILGDLTARNIDGLGFAELANNALRPNNGNRTILIKGWKNFQTLELQDLRLEGKIMGRETNELLLKSSRQILTGKRLFEGTLTAPAVITNGTINDVNLKYLVNNQMKKRGPVQIIHSPMNLANNMTIFGNMTVDGLYEGVDLTELHNFETSQTDLDSVLRDTSVITSIAEGIDVALANRAIYWNKLELLEKNSTPLIPNPQSEKFVNLDKLGRCVIRESSLYLNDRLIFDAYSTFQNASNIVRTEIFVVSGISFVATITKNVSGGISVYRYVVDENRFDHVAGLIVPGIVEGFVMMMDDSLWFSLRLLDSTMIVRHELGSLDFKRWIISGGEAFHMSLTPTNELLILRRDGVWRLGGLAGPRHIFSADLPGHIETFTFDNDHYVQLSDDNNVTSLFKTRYFGN